MISFEVTAIDLILGLSIIVLLVLYIAKFSKTEEEKILSNIRGSSKGLEEESQVLGHILKHQSDYTECPRGFGNVKNLSEDNSVSEKCIGCYRLMECYTE